MPGASMAGEALDAQIEKYVINYLGSMIPGFGHATPLDIAVSLVGLRAMPGAGPARLEETTDAVFTELGLPDPTVENYEETARTVGTRVAAVMDAMVERGTLVRRVL